MNNYRKIVEDALKKSKQKKMLNESVVYPEGITERMHEKLEDDLVNRNHSLGEHPIFPEGDESTFEEKLMGERFTEVVNRYKRYFDTDRINNRDVIKETLPMVYETMGIEAKHKKALEKLAVEMIREEYNMGEDVVEIHAELTDTINMEGTKKNPKPMATEVEFKNHDEMVSANEEVYKRRFINSMIQGAAKKCNHMFHMADDKLIEMDPRLPNKYAKMMSAADYMYYVVPDLSGSVNGGVVRVQFPTASNPKAVIHAQAMVLPVLIHELVKGVMELVSAHGLPKKKRIGEYVINKADFLAAEPWDMRLGPGIWSRFTKMINPDDFNLKHHIYMEMVSLPVREFNTKMREVMAGTKEGKKIIDEMVKGIKAGLQEDEFNESMNEISTKGEKNSDIDSDNKGFDFDELMGGKDGSDSDNDLDGYNFEDLFK
jgi:effector-binding domain-containing protein